MTEGEERQKIDHAATYLGKRGENKGKERGLSQFHRRCQTHRGPFFEKGKKQQPGREAKERKISQRTPAAPRLIITRKRR